MNRCLILCAGEMRRWGNFLGVPKQLVPVEGEVLLDRTIRLLGAHGAGDIVVIAAKPGLERDGAREEIVSPNLTGTLADKFLSSRHLWPDSGVIRILFGDVWFSDHAIARLLEPPTTIRFFGRMTGSIYTGCKYGEIFALAFPARKTAMLDAALTEIQLLGPEGRGKASGWALYRNLVERQNRHGGAPVTFVHLDDFTDDFDLPVDLERWTRGRNRPALAPGQDIADPKSWRRRVRRGATALAIATAGSLLTLAVQAAF